MTHRIRSGQLYLNDEFAGEVLIRGWEGAWGFGEFRPCDNFQKHAALFEQWSRLMHVNESADQLSRDIAEQLRKVECALYRIRARLFLMDSKTWRQISILNIDSNLIEWKEQWSSTVEPSAKHDVHREELYAS